MAHGKQAMELGVMIRVINLIGAWSWSRSTTRSGSWRLNDRGSNNPLFNSMKSWDLNAELSLSWRCSLGHALEMAESERSADQAHSNEALENAKRWLELMGDGK